MNKYNLPKKYLSYSAISTWLRDPYQFRRRYYHNDPMIMTPELHFGSKIAKLLEKKHDSMNHIKQYPVMEQRMKVEIEGVPFFGFIDSFDPMDCAILEYKTGVTPWNEERVKDHLQLDLYSLAVETIFGKVQDEAELIWMQTRKIEKPREGRVTHEEAYEIEFTGKVKSFVREITKEDRDNTRSLLVEVAEAISSDYSSWLEQKNQQQSGGRVAYRFPS